MDPGTEPERNLVSNDEACNARKDYINEFQMKLGT